jgi:hypothetical protein
MVPHRCTISLTARASTRHGIPRATAVPCCFVSVPCGSGPCDGPIRDRFGEAALTRASACCWIRPWDDGQHPDPHSGIGPSEIGLSGIRPWMPHNTRTHIRTGTAHAEADPRPHPCKGAQGGAARFLSLSLCAPVTPAIVAEPQHSVRTGRLELHLRRCGISLAYSEGSIPCRAGS